MVPLIHVTDIEGWDVGDLCVFGDVFISDVEQARNVKNALLTSDGGQTVKVVKVDGIGPSEFNPPLTPLAFFDIVGRIVA